MQVYIDPSAPNAGKVAEAFNNWSGASGSFGNNSGVTYTIVSSPPPAGTYSYTVSGGTAASGDRATTTTTVDAQGHTIAARTIIDSRVTDPAAILEVMAHEIGHPAGLGDCTICSPADSVMALGATDYNDVIGRATSPTPCDNQALQQTDYPPCNPPVNTQNCQIWDPNTCTCAQYTSGGGGGGDSSGGTTRQYQGCTEYDWVVYRYTDNGWMEVARWYAGCF